MKRTQYKLCFKQTAIRLYKKKKSIRKVAIELSIYRRTVRRWVQQKKTIKKASYKTKKTRVPRQKPSISQNYEKQLHEWILEKRATGSCLNAFEIRQKMLDIVKDDENMKNFKASFGWFRRFLKRYKLSRRRISTTGRDFSKNCLNTITNFIEKCKKENEKVNRCLIFNMDETSIYLDSPPNYTYDQRGSKRVKASTAGSEISRLSLAFSASADGTKLPVLILVPRKRPLNDFVPPDNVVLYYKTKATFDAEVIQDVYLKRVFIPHAQRKKLIKPRLYFDNATCHTKPQIDKYLTKNGICKSLVPPRMTNILQPADVSWMAIIKKQFHDKWLHWYLHDHKNYTKSGNMKSAGYAQVIQWISDIWDAFDKDIIETSFDLCGITNSDPNYFHSTLKKMVIENIIINEVIEDDDGAMEFEGFGDHDEDEEEDEEEDDEEEDVESDESTDFDDDVPLAFYIKGKI